ncbi:MAG: fructose-bisphosphatase class III [Lachnospiraceae bacterium]|nr:fructose-bisphosphatase class III [Lachnospiraceae bacterium]
MAKYVISDIHGEYDMFLEMLDKIGLKDSDELYVLGDVVDRGPHPLKILLKMMEMPNVVPIVGNHELMALDGLKFLNSKITNETIASVNAETLGNLLAWQESGSAATIAEFRTLDARTREEILEYIPEFSMFEEVEAGGKDYLLVHAGLGNYRPDKDILDYSLRDIAWSAADYGTRYFDNIFVVTGHTPTQFIAANPKPGYIYKANNHIAIDCGASFNGGRLAAIRLDDGAEFYVERGKND